MRPAMADTLKIYEILKEAQIPDPHRVITQAIRESDWTVANEVRAILDDRFQHAATKADLAEFRADFAEFKAATRAEIAELKTSMADMRSDLMRWMFVFWAGQMAATVGIVFTAFKIWR